MHAVLAEAVSCFQKGAVAEGRQAQRLAREAEEWLFADDPTWSFSFVNICAVLGLDPAYIRLGLTRWQQGCLTKLPKGRRRVTSVCQPWKLSA